MQTLKLVRSLIKYMKLKTFTDRADNRVSDLVQRESEDFSVTYKSNDDPELEFKLSGEAQEGDRWGENKFVVDLNLESSVKHPETWEEFSEEINDVTRRVRSVLMENVGFSGPIILRSSNNENEKSWARRVILDEDETVGSVDNSSTGQN